MKIVTNQKVIKRNKLIGQITTYLSLAILAVGLYLSFKQTYVTLSFIALLVGFLLSQIGIYYGSRWGKSPRPDESVGIALKGLDNKYILYNYHSPVPHLLVGPAGVWTLIPYAQRGTITYDEKRKRWNQKGGNIYLKIFAQEGLARPDLEVQNLNQSMLKFLKKNCSGEEMPDLGTILIFTNEKADIQIENAPIPTLPSKKLKDFIRRQAKENPVAIEQIERLENCLPEE